MSPTTPLSLLLVAPDGDAASGAALAAPGVDVTRCASFAEAQAMLAAAAFDVVCVAGGVAGDPGGLQAPRGRALPVFVLAAGGDAAPGARALSPDATADDLRRALAQPPLAQAGPPAPNGAPATAGDPAALLGLIDHLRREVGRVVHAANNPMTVITGNAQFLLELAGAGLVEPEIARALEDIEAAARKLQEELGGLANLRQQLATVLATADSL